MAEQLRVTISSTARDLPQHRKDLPDACESKFEPMPEVEIDPDDEFHTGTETQA
jgi:hypothetical protein